MAETPERPDTGEIAAPADYGTVGHSSWDQSAAWRSAVSLDPRMAWGANGTIDLFEATLADTHVRAMLSQRLDAGVAPPLEIEPGGTARRDRLAAEDLVDQMEAIGIDRITRELLHAIWYGYAVAEAIWDIDGGRVRLADLKVRDPRIIRWDTRTQEPLLVTRAKPAGQALPPAKFTLLTNPRSHGGEPHGPGIANWCFWPVWFKRMGYSGWAAALERFGVPVAYVTLGQKPTQAEQQAALDALAAIRNGTGLLLKEGQAIDVLEAQARAGGDFNLFTRDMDRMIADAIVGQHGTAEIGPHVGTGEVHMKVLERLVTADARRVCDALRASVATWLTGWNFPGAAVPRLSRDTAPPEDLVARASRDATIAAASGLRPTPAYVKRVYGGEWERGPLATPPTRSEEMPPVMLAAQPATPRTAIDDLVNHLVGEDIATATAAPILDPIDAVLAEATTLEDLRARLDGLEDQPSPEALASLIARADFAASLAGAAGAPIEPDEADEDG